MFPLIIVEVKRTTGQVEDETRQDKLKPQAIKLGEFSHIN